MEISQLIVDSRTHAGHPGNGLYPAAQRADTKSMSLALWGDDWFQRWMGALLVVQGALMLLLGIVSVVPTPSFGLDTSSAASVAPETAGDVAAAVESEPVPAAPTAGGSFVINDGAGKVGNLKLGMTIGQVRGQLGEQLVPIQEASTSNGHFEFLAPESGLRVEGTGRRIDTITVSNTGTGNRYRTTKGIAIGTPERLIGDKYVYAYLVCGTEWWIDRGDTTLRFRADRTVTAITLTRRKREPYVECA